MRTGQFKIMLVNDNIEPYQTNGVGNLLNHDNFSEVWNFHKFNPPGAYVKKYPEDMAIASILITQVQDADGRKHKNNDTVIVKLDANDALNLLNLADEHHHLSSRMQAIQRNNGHTLCNPLPEVTL